MLLISPVTSSLEITLRVQSRNTRPTPPAAFSPHSPEKTIVPSPQRRVLVCQGGPCNDAGAAQFWNRLRQEEKRVDLRKAGGASMSARTSCLGPCRLGPVVQVFPEGTDESQRLAHFVRSEVSTRHTGCRTTRSACPFA